MKKKPTEYLEKLFEIDKHVEDGVFCQELSEEDKKAFEEHAKKRKQNKDKRLRV